MKIFSENIKKMNNFMTCMVIFSLLILSIGEAGASPVDLGSLSASDIGKVDISLLNDMLRGREETVKVLMKLDTKRVQPDLDREDTTLVMGVKGSLEERVMEAGGELKGNVLDYAYAEVPINNLPALAEDDFVEIIYEEQVYYPMLENSGQIIKADGFWDAGYTGQGVKIAILDSGVDSDHEMLQGKIVAQEVFTGDSSTEDVYGHGTKVAGIAAGRNISGLSGIAPGASILNGKIIADLGYGGSYWTALGIEWAVDPDGDPETDDGADVISMSIGTLSYDTDPAVEDAIDYAISNGVTVVVASGNCREGYPSPACGEFTGVTSPGSLEQVITVGAVFDDFYPVSYSGGEDYGSYIKPDVVAPGVGVTTSCVGGDYCLSSGTSMATPHVGGAAALMLEKNPDIGHDFIKQKLEEYATDLGDPGKDTQFGSGVVNMSGILAIVNSSIECTIDIHCEHLNSVPYCSADLIVQDTGYCVDYGCSIQTTTIEDCNDNNVQVCQGTEIVEEDHTCSAASCIVDSTTVIEDCDDGLFCNGQESCDSASCVSGQVVDCSGNDLPVIETCTNDPDNSPLTWDYSPGFTSSCDEQADSCTQGSHSFTHTCDVARCGAGCDPENPCADTGCDHLDGCYGDDYYDYENVSNSCLSDCNCEQNACSDPVIHTDHPDCMTYELDLKSGWNLVSMPKDGSITPQEIHSILGDPLESIYAYVHDGSAEGWEYYVTTFPENFNTLASIDYKQGFWINVNQDTLLELEGAGVTQQAYLLEQGWNLLNYPFGIEQSIEDYFGSDITNVYSVYRYDAENGSWDSWYYDRPAELNTLDNMKSGYGYWVEMDSGIELDVDI